MKNEIVIRVRLDEKTFRRYLNFDTFRLKRRWFWPVMAAMICLTAALFFLLFRPGTADTLAGILTGLAIGIPMVCFGLYFIQLQVQVSAMKLKEHPEIYSLWLREEHVRVVSAGRPEAPADLYWNQFYAAYRRSDCIYLYVNPQRAFLLPEGQASVSSEDLWDFIRKSMSSGRCLSVR